MQAKRAASKAFSECAVCVHRKLPYLAELFLGCGFACGRCSAPWRAPAAMQRVRAPVIVIIKGHATSFTLPVCLGLFKLCTHTYAQAHAHTHTHTRVCAGAHTDMLLQLRCRGKHNPCLGLPTYCQCPVCVCVCGCVCVCSSPPSLLSVYLLRLPLPLYDVATDARCDDDSLCGHTHTHTHTHTQTHT